MRRREFITCLAGMAAMRPLATNAAGERIWRVGLLSNSPPPSASSTTSWRYEVLLVLAQNGFSAGKNLELVERYSDGDADRLPLLAREINVSGVDAIIATSLESVRAALSASQTTPVVMVVGYDPVKAGLVASFAHPGGRVTGIVF